MGRAEHTSGQVTPLGGGTPSVPVPPAQRRAPSRSNRTAEAYAVGAPRRAPVPSRGRLGFRSVLRNKHFLRLWVAQLISQTIMNAANYGIIILIATQSKSVTATGGAIAAFSLPAALFGAPAGVYVDRLDKRRVLWMSNALRAIASLGFVLTLIINSNALIPVYALIFFIALVGQFFAPAEGAAIPLLVHEDELVNALALFNITFTLSQAAGLIVMGPLIVATLVPYSLGNILGLSLTISPVESLFVIVAILYVVCALLVATIPHRRLLNRVTNEHSRVHARNGERIWGIWAGIAECWTFIRRDHTLFASVLQLSLGGTVIAVIAEIAPSFVHVFFNLPEKYAALVFMPAGAGLIIGSIALPHIIKRINHRANLVGAGVLVLAGCTVLLTFAHSVATHVRPDTWSRSPFYFVGILLLTFLMGLGLDLINIPAQTTMQELSPDWIKGRVLALQMMLFNAVTVPVVFVIGLTADYFHLPPAMNALAALVFAGGFASILYGRKARQRPLVVSRARTRSGPSTPHEVPPPADSLALDGRAPRRQVRSRPLERQSVEPVD